MKKVTKGFLIVFFIIFTTFTALAFISNGSYGATGSKYFGLYLKSGQSSRNGRPTGFYTSGTKNNGNSKVPIVKIIETSGTGGSAGQKPNTDNEVIYCLNNGIGFGDGDSSRINICAI